MILSTPTMFVVIIAVSAILATAIAFTAYRRQQDLLVWAVALAMHAVAYTLFGLRGQISDFVSIVVGNFALATVFALFGEAIYLFQRRSPPRWLLWTPVVIVTISFVFLLNEQQTRFVVSGLVFSLQCLFILVAVFDQRYKTVGRGQYLLATGVIVVLCLLLFRALAVLVGGVHLGSFTDTNPMQGFALLITVFATLSLALGLLTMNQERLGQTAASATAKLRASEQHYRLLIENANEGIGVAVAGIMRFVNPEMIKITGYSEEEILGHRFVDFVHEGDREIALANYQRRLRGEIDKLKYVVRIVTKHKGVRCFEINGSMFDWEGQPATLNFLNDITERQRTEAELRQSEERYRTLTEWSPEPLVVHDGTKFIYANPAAIRLFGATSAQDMMGKPIFDRVHPDFRDLSRARVKANTEQGGTLPMQEMRFLRLDGMGIDVEVQSTSIAYDGAAALQVALRDVTERKVAERKFLESESRYRRIVENSPDIVYAFSMTKGGLYYSPTVLAVLGYPVEHLIANPLLWAESIHPEDRLVVGNAVESFKTGIPFRIEYRVKDSEGDWHWLFDRSIGVREVDDDFVVEGLATDITERKQAESQIEALAFSDPLTGLPNRRLLMDRLEQAITAAARHGHQTALLFVDLDDFKTLNDTLGHDKGDMLLKQIAQRLIACVREGDTVARLGGDEFVVLLEDLSSNVQESATQAQGVTAKILSALGQPYEIEGHGHHSSASIGVTLFGGSEREAIEEPLKRAELAMYQAKAAGRNTLRFFDPEMRTAVAVRATLEAELREAVSIGQFVLHYQPQAGGDSRLSGAEALVRWQHPKRGLVSPAEFIPVAETSGLILPLGRWVLETACKQLAAWAARPETLDLTMSVNVSAREFRQPEFVEEVVTILEATGANPNRLKLELTESVLVDNVEEVIGKMNALKAKGVCFSLDDFGTGYSSLSYLKRLPLDQLKIDQGFVRDILTDPNDAAIAKMVLVLAATLGLTVVAEGVETEAQRWFLASMGCDNYQGYLFSRPLPIDEFEVFARGRWSVSEPGSI